MYKQHALVVGNEYHQEHDEYQQDADNDVGVVTLVVVGHDGPLKKYRLAFLTASQRMLCTWACSEISARFVRLNFLLVFRSQKDTNNIDKFGHKIQFKNTKMIDFHTAIKSMGFDTYKQYLFYEHRRALKNSYRQSDVLKVCFVCGNKR